MGGCVWRTGWRQRRDTVPSCRAGWRTCSMAGLLAWDREKRAHTMTECGTGGRARSTSWKQGGIGLLSLAHQTSHVNWFGRGYSALTHRQTERDTCGCSPSSFVHLFCVLIDVLWTKKLLLLFKTIPVTLSSIIVLSHFLLLLQSLATITVYPL